MIRVYFLVLRYQNENDEKWGVGRLWTEKKVWPKMPHL